MTLLWSTDVASSGNHLPGRSRAELRLCRCTSGFPLPLICSVQLPVVDSIPAQFGQQGFPRSMIGKGDGEEREELYWSCWESLGWTSWHPHQAREQHLLHSEPQHSLFPFLQGCHWLEAEDGYRKGKKAKQKDDLSSPGWSTGLFTSLSQSQSCPLSLQPTVSGIAYLFNKVVIHIAPRQLDAGKLSSMFPFLSYFKSSLSPSSSESTWHLCNLGSPIR